MKLNNLAQYRGACIPFKTLEGKPRKSLIRWRLRCELGEEAWDTPQYREWSIGRAPEEKSCARNASASLGVDAGVQNQLNTGTSVLLSDKPSAGRKG